MSQDRSHLRSRANANVLAMAVDLQGIVLPNEALAQPFYNGGDHRADGCKETPRTSGSPLWLHQLGSRFG